MRWRKGERPTCASCAFYNTDGPHFIGGHEAQRLYTQAEETGGACTQASTPFRQPSSAVCARYEGPALPWWTNLFGAISQLRVRKALAQEALDSLALVRDDAAVLRCALSDAWRRANEARARSHELWAVVRPALADGSIPSIWRDRFINLTVTISRFLMSLGDRSALHAVQEAGVTNLGILIPERDTGALCAHCDAALNTWEYVDPVDQKLICRDCAAKIGVST